MIMEARGGDIYGLNSFFMPVNHDHHFFRKRRAVAINSEERNMRNNKFPSPRELAFL